MKCGRRATLWDIFLVFTGVMLVLYACRKQDHITKAPVRPDDQELPAGRFFSAYQSPNPSIKAVQQYLAGLDKKHSFSDLFLSQVGLPRWDKSLVYGAAGSVSTESGEAATVVYIPFVREGQLFVNSTMVIRMTATDTAYRVIGNWQYGQYGFEDGGTENWDARDIFNIFSRLDKVVFGYTRYRIKDGRIFGQEQTTGLTVAEQQPNGPTTEDFSLVCTSKTVCITASPSTNSTYHTETECTTNTECFLVWTGGGGNNPTGGGSGGSGSGGGSGGSGGGPLPPNPCPSTNSYVADSTSNPCDTTGWAPLPTKKNPCAGVDSLAANSTFRQIYSALSGAVTDTVEYGVMFNQDGQGNITGPPTNTRGQNAANPNLNFTISYTFDGIVHSHLAGNLSIFSAADIGALAKLYRSGNIRNIATFVFGVVTPSGTQYLLKIEDETKFATFANKMAQPFGLDALEADYFAYNIMPDMSAENNEPGFLFMLLKRATGLKLFKGTADYTSWQPIKYQEGATSNVAPAPCN